LAPGQSFCIPRNGADIPRNTGLVPGNILAPGKGPNVPGNAKIVPRNKSCVANSGLVVAEMSSTYMTLNLSLARIMPIAGLHGKLISVYPLEYAVMKVEKIHIDLHSLRQRATS